MKTYKLGVLYGDGIGPEIVKSTVDVFVAAENHVGNVNFDYVELPMGWQGIKKYNDPVPEITKKELKTCDGWLFGPHDSAAYPPEHLAKLNPSGEMRHYFDLYSNVRPNKAIPGAKSLVGNDVDMVIFRENTEGFYPDRNMYKGIGEFMASPDVAIVAGLFTKKAAERIAHSAFRLAMKRRKKVTIVHKANVIKLGYGLFRDTCREVGKLYPEVQVDDYHIDAMTAHLVRRAKDFDVIVTTNMFGDILSDLVGELTGSLGLAPSINTNDHQAMAQAAHGSAPDIAGKNISNPVGMLLSGVMLLDWMAERHNDPALEKMARTAENAIMKTLANGICTPDLGGSASTTGFTEAIVEKIKQY
ncbi:isocitrate/isopropylmalate dehydrogenase family protein [Sporomusa acidovorans]|uniref:Homoisocitrate dehydrogenase n=1 Tax=Sporomusa acidovorans (strain ATCC 49682 / DSM 3132 / Mol) TaxID=1123286 RepID=A0ABZ3J227_SPOA4|nr:isocitrate/isopropylmalate dehydrogenase family protein [Sporomusa acidovorans]OZC24137.1 homoisocitrate dehydrogenase [Sporomusa acidovorans DSM 3132]SDF36783.1 3-isopropylmalate dehydrogenase [Sporomusa acidovorans]